MEAFLEIGPSWQFDFGKVKPNVHAGFAASEFFNNKSYKDIHIEQIQALGRSADVAIGFYAGVGSAFQIGKGAILLNVDYRYRHAGTAGMGIHGIDATVGYQF